ncbi:MAG TPA: hypothetical protein VJB14_05535 [Planctomycetota bacterium]|nr:hypothetical protein [Planctomycetota bacterium]
MAGFAGKIAAVLLLLAQGAPEKDPSFFPIGVWLQDTRNAAAYKAAGINVYVALWRGPTNEQLDALKAAGLKAICRQNSAGLARKDDPTILAWMHGDEPDNAQPNQGGGYGPPIPPEKIVEDYKRLKAADPSRPVLLNLGQGVAWDDYVGRGVRRNHPEDYPEYLKGCDIASFDIYPVVHDKPEVAGKLWFVPQGVERLRKGSNDEKPVWNCIEASRIDNPTLKATVSQIRSEVWMSLIHGSRGLIYFVHQFKPTFIEASLLRDVELLKGVTEINRQVRELAPVLNSPTVRDGATATSSSADAPVAAMVKRHGGAAYLFAVGMREQAVKGSFALKDVKAGTAEVLGEGRTIPVRDGAFVDDFKPYEAHLYMIK